MDKTILLIGPMGVGKSTVARLLAQRLSLPVLDIDSKRWELFAAMDGFDKSVVSALFDAGQGLQAFEYMKPFEAALVEQLLAGVTEGIIDFGAGYTVYDDDRLFERVRKAFMPFKGTVLLAYSPDNNESLEALSGRHDLPQALYYALNRAFISSPCNSLIANRTVYTKGKTPEQIANEILANDK